MAQVKLESEALGSGGAPLTQKRESLFKDAFGRLLRNRAAVLGGTLIIILILMAVFAPLVAVKSFEVQVLVDQNVVPKWVTNIFPTMKPYARIS